MNTTNKYYQYTGIWQHHNKKDAPKIVSKGHKKIAFRNMTQKQLDKFIKDNK